MENLPFSISTQIADQTLLLNNLIWVQAAVLVVFGATVTFSSAYLKKRAELLATKSDFDTLKQQLKDTTEVVEKVKAEISHQDWSAREWKSVRKLKIEEVVAVAYSFYKWAIEEGQRAKTFGPHVAATMLIDEANTTCSLYLPELTPSMLEFTHKRTFLIACLFGMRKFNQGSFIDDLSRRSWDYKIEELRQAEIALMGSFLNLENAAVQLMQELHGINTTSPATTELSPSVVQ